MNRGIECSIIDFSTRLAERQAEKDRQNEIRLRMKYGDFRYEIAEEVADCPDFSGSSSMIFPLISIATILQ